MTEVAMYDRVAGTPEMTLRQALRRGWIFVVLGLIVSAIVGVAALQVLPKTYGSSAAVLVRPVGVLTDSSTGSRLVSDVNLDTEAQLVKSRIVASSAASTLNSSESSESLIQSVSVEVPPNTTILRINFAASTRESAAEGAQAFADAYLAHREESAQQDIDQQLDRLNNHVRALNKRLRVLTTRIVELPSNSPKRLVKATQLQLVRSGYQDLQAQSTALDAARVSPGEVISDARPPTSAAAPTPLVVLASSNALGLLGGLSMAWLTRFRFYRLGWGDDVEALTGKPLLASIAGNHADPITLTPHQVAHFQDAWSAGGHPVVIMYPMTARVPVVSVAVSVAEGLAHEGRRIALAGDRDHMPDEMAAQLAAAADGTMQRQGGESRLYPSAADTDRLVLVVGAPLAQLVAPRPPADCGAAVIVFEAGRTSVRQAQQAIQRVDLAGVPVAGLVLVVPTPRLEERQQRSASAEVARA